MWTGRRGRWGGGGAISMQGRVRLEVRGTVNMYSMAVTLERSKLSGWLNVYASYRVARTAYEAGRGVDREARGR